MKGPASAKVTVVAFSDFQCPFCSRAVPVLKQIEDEYKGKVKIAFKQLPLPFHDKAHLAAEAALAANEQGKFWQMHDKLFANQQALDRPSLEKYAEELGLNMAKFKAALDSASSRTRSTPTPRRAPRSAPPARRPSSSTARRSSALSRSTPSRPSSTPSSRPRVNRTPVDGTSPPKRLALDPEPRPAKRDEASDD